MILYAWLTEIRYFAASCFTNPQGTFLPRVSFISRYDLRSAFFSSSRIGSARSSRIGGGVGTSRETAAPTWKPCKRHASANRARRRANSSPLTVESLRFEQISKPIRIHSSISINGTSSLIRHLPSTEPTSCLVRRSPSAVHEVSRRQTIQERSIV